MSCERMQTILIDNYLKNSGPVLKEQIEISSYYQWIGMFTGLYDISKSLWKKLSNGELQMGGLEKNIEYGQLFEIIKNVFNFIGEVNGHKLQENSFFGKIVISYVTLRDERFSDFDLFRLKLENYFARKIMIQNSMTRKMLEDEQFDRELTRKIRSKVRKKSKDSQADKSNEERLICNNDEVLYIYKGLIVCHKNKHNIIQATAILYNQTDSEIKLNVEYCTECKKFFLEYSIFEQYRERFGALIGNLQLVKNGEFTGGYELADESPLHIIGYNVGQKDDFSNIERQYILARVLYGKIMTKAEVVKYLSFFIRRNGAKNGNERALTKWKEDLVFVQEYDINIQPHIIISTIRKY